MDNERIEEALELLWLLEEDNHHELERFRLNSDDPDIDSLIELMTRKGLINIRDGMIFLSEEGSDKARALIRRHRLAERLFTDVFKMKVDQVESDACKMEHILSEELTDSVCTFLGHPPACPHGKPIPRGECCEKYRTEVTPVVVRLLDLEIGSEGRIVFIIPSEASRIGRLSSIGIAPGSIIRLIQKVPSYVIQIEETTIALDPEIAKDILVKRF